MALASCIRRVDDATDGESEKKREPHRLWRSLRRRQPQSPRPGRTAPASTRRTRMGLARWERVTALAGRPCGRSSGATRSTSRRNTSTATRTASPASRPDAVKVRRLGGAAAVVVVALALLAAAAPAAPTVYRVARVIDGDTIELTNGQRVRLVQIDTPEVYGGYECYGPAASATAKRLLPPGTRVRLQFEPASDSVDRYGRLLRYVVRVDDGVNVNVHLVRGLVLRRRGSTTANAAATSRSYRRSRNRQEQSGSVFGVPAHERSTTHTTQSRRDGDPIPNHHVAPTASAPLAPTRTPTTTGASSQTGQANSWCSARSAGSGSSVSLGEIAMRSAAEYG